MDENKARTIIEKIDDIIKEHDDTRRRTGLL